MLILCCCPAYPRPAGRVKSNGPLRWPGSRQPASTSSPDGTALVCGDRAPLSCRREDRGDRPRLPSLHKSSNVADRSASTGSTKFGRATATWFRCLVLAGTPTSSARWRGAPCPFADAAGLIETGPVSTSGRAERFPCTRWGLPPLDTQADACT